MRGEDTSPEGLVQAAQWADAVYLTRYRPGGKLELEHVGAVRPTVELPSTPPLAGWRVAPSAVQDAVQLVEAAADVSAARVLTLRLTWRCLQSLREHDTIFVHFWQGGEFRGGADGDSLGTLVPLYAWQAGTDIVDVRHVDVSGLGTGSYQVKVGLYNRVDSVRYPARDMEGKRFPDDEAPALTIALP
jgi:hypothetical protein